MININSTFVACLARMLNIHLSSKRFMVDMEYIVRDTKNQDRTCS